MNKQQIEGVWKAILEMIKIANMAKVEPRLKYRCMDYTFRLIDDEKCEIKAQLEGDATYLTMRCGSSRIDSGKMFTGEAPDDFLPIENTDLREMLKDLLPEGTEEAIQAATDKMRSVPTVNSVVRRIQQMRAAQESATTRVGGSRPGLK